MTVQPDSFFDAQELSRLDDPFVRQRCVKLKRQNAFQAALQATMILMFTAAIFLLLQGHFGGRSRSGRYHPPNPALIPYGNTALTIGLVALVGLFCCRNYYLLDPSQHRLYHCFRFLWWGRNRIVFRQGEIFGVTTTGRRRQTRYGSYWEYCLTAVGMNGKQEPLNDWRRDSLEARNAQAVDLATKLGCQSFSAPLESKLRVELTGGTPQLHFD
ncbi:MAG TPA: hypothetical protein VGR14_18885 [Verrucomicrobiae bacterium]|nr:hypothetical protein [Verrucomicrobiae bacterium]